MIKPKSWEDTMTPSEVKWCWKKLRAKADIYSEFVGCIDNWRAAQAWKSSQTRRFKKQVKMSSGCNFDWVDYKWNWRKFRFDEYILGFDCYY